MKNKCIIDGQVKKAIKQPNQLVWIYDQKPLRLTKLVCKVHTHIFVVSRQKGWYTLVLKNTIGLHSWHRIVHRFWKDITNESYYFTIMEYIINDIT